MGPIGEVLKPNSYGRAKDLVATEQAYVIDPMRDEGTGKILADVAKGDLASAAGKLSDWGVIEYFQEMHDGTRAIIGRVYRTQDEEKTDMVGLWSKGIRTEKPFYEEPGKTTSKVTLADAIDIFQGDISREHGVKTRVTFLREHAAKDILENGIQDPDYFNQTVIYMLSVLPYGFSIDLAYGHEYPSFMRIRRDLVGNNLIFETEEEGNLDYKFVQTDMYSKKAIEILKTFHREMSRCLSADDPCILDIRSVIPS